MHNCFRVEPHINILPEMPAGLGYKGASSVLCFVEMCNGHGHFSWSLKEDESIDFTSNLLVRLVRLWFHCAKDDTSPGVTLSQFMS